MATPPWTPWIEDLKRALAVRDRAATNAAVTQLLDGGAPLGAQWKSISELMRVSGELTLAHRAMDAFVGAARAGWAFIRLSNTGRRAGADR